MTSARLLGVIAIASIPRLFGTVGRGTSSTDNSPMGMVNTTITLKPREQWRPGMTYEALQSEMDAALQFPGLPNVWTQPIDGGAPRQETRFTAEIIRNFDWSRDGRLLVSRYNKTRDVILIRNFR